MNRGAPKVELQTTIGSFVVELYVDHAPRTCKNFLELSKRGYYNGTRFHRVIRVSSQPQSRPQHRAAPWTRPVDCSTHFNHFKDFIQDFMIQGGDPTGTGRGGESIWGKTFEVRSF